MNNWKQLPYQVATDGKRYRVAFTDTDGVVTYVIEINYLVYIWETRFLWRARAKANKLNRYYIKHQ